MADRPRVRFAPSPTGELHVGNARTALFNWMFARHHGGSLVLRIEDTDESRSALSYQVNLLDDLKWLGLDWDEGPEKDGAYGPYKQSERLDLYAQHLKKLIDADLVYPCYCTEEELEEERQALILSKRMPRYMGKCRNLSAGERDALAAQGRKPSWRFKVPPKTVEFNDLVRGLIRFEGESIGDFIIVRSNGMPAYNFAVVIDDHLMAITHVIRGEDHLSNTALQIMLYRAFGFEPPVFAHHCLILGKDHAKLSKRHGSVSVGEFCRKGYLPEALLNYLGLLGSSFADAREVLSQSEMVEAFSLERASKSGAVFDEEKLRWLNSVYIRSLTADDLMNRLWPFLHRAGYQPEELDPLWLKQVIETVKDELTELADIGEHIALFFDSRYRMTSEAKQVLDSANARKVVLAFSDYLASAIGSPQEIYIAAIKHAKEISGVKGRDLYMPVRAALTGKIKGPELDKVFVILGKDSAWKRLKTVNQ
ncbi:MAG: glutamate--tRNA ligase [Deltaproteobacteria bacterium HGW-Deltaproteobacteria-9]|nr:MAG: glutamate--tRNA ligase [Deltaproteobacteria bacterium HGW-Deltaproteobacteria-9]